MTGDRALETARKVFVLAHGWQWCELSEREWNSLSATQRERLASIAVEVQSAMNAEPQFIDFCESPCGHSSRYAYTENGGKNIECLLCNRESAMNAQERALREALRESCVMLKIVTRRLRPESVQEFLDKSERLLAERREKQ